jgi:hypothetical protein
MSGAALVDLASPHLQAFKERARDAEDAPAGEGNVPSDWVPDNVVDRKHLPTVQLTRTRLLELAADRSLSIDALCWSILAWGGMYDSNRNRLGRVSDRSWQVGSWRSYVLEHHRPPPIFVESA